METVIHHSADYDGIFCRQIARKVMPQAHLIGWDFGDPLLAFPKEGTVYVLDLPPSVFADLPPSEERNERLVWIDHHKSAIIEWDHSGGGIPGYRIDGVAACRLAWQFFSLNAYATKEDFQKRGVTEPVAVALAGEYDVWDHEPSNGADITFQFGLDSVESLDWDQLLQLGPSRYCSELITNGLAVQQCYKKRDADIVRHRSFDIDFEGLHFLALNTARCNSQTFESGVKPEHDGCIGFYWNGKIWIVSLYGVEHKPDVDLSEIAVKHGGGGHKQACGFSAKLLPWWLPS